MNRRFFMKFKDFEWDFPLAYWLHVRVRLRGDKIYSINFFWREEIFQTVATSGAHCGRTGARGERPSFASRI